MALTYPLTLPTTIGFESIELKAVNAVARPESQFSYVSRTLVHPGQRWAATVTIPPLRRDIMAPWTAFLTALKGQTGTFLMGDPDYQDGPLGTVSSCTLTGTAGSGSPTVTMTGSLLAGDYIQLGTGANARLHKVLQDRTGNGTLEIWPNLRANYTSAPVIVTATKGVFRLASNTTAWSINNSNAYGVSFTAAEVI